MNPIATLTVGLTLACAATVPVTISAQTRWDLPAAYPATNFHTQLLQQFAQDVAALSHGKLAITVHENASLYKAPEIKRAVQGGQAQIGEILLSNFANEDPLFELDSLPFLTTDYESAWRLYQAQKPTLQKKLQSQGMLLLYSVAWPPQGFYSNRDLHTVADMRGMKLRAQTPVVARVAELIGAQPVTVQAADLSQALATRMVDSTMTSGSTGYDAKIYEYLKKFYDTRANQPRNAVIVNRRAFETLDAETQQAVWQAAAKAETAGWQLSRERTVWYLEQLRAHGMDIITPDAELMAGLNKIGAVMLNDWLDKAGADGHAVITAYRQHP